MRCSSSRVYECQLQCLQPEIPEAVRKSKWLRPSIWTRSKGGSKTSVRPIVGRPNCQQNCRQSGPCTSRTAEKEKRHDDYSQDENVKRHVRKNRWISVDIGGKPYVFLFPTSSSNVVFSFRLYFELNQSFNSIIYNSFLPSDFYSLKKKDARRRRTFFFGSTSSALDFLFAFG